MAKKKLLIATLIGAGILVAGTVVAQAHEHGKHEHGKAEPGKHSHDHGGTGGGPASAGLKLNNGKKWETDAKLQAGMSAIQAAVGAAIGPIHSDNFSAAQYKELSEKIDKEIQGIMNKCKLAPEVDVQFHLVLADLFGGTAAMRAEGDRTAGVLKVIRALEAYGKFFQHPGWKPLDH